MELGGGSRNNQDERGRYRDKPSLRKLKSRLVYNENFSEDSVEEVEIEVEKPKSIMEMENLANQKLKDLGHQEDVDTMSYEEKIQLIKIYEESTEMAALDKIASDHYQNEAFEENHIVDVEEDQGNLFQTRNMETVNIHRLRSRNVSVVRISSPSSTTTRERLTEHFDSVPSPEKAVSDNNPSQVPQNRQVATLHLKRPPLSKPDPSISFTKEQGLRIPSELAARRKAILKKWQENDWVHPDCSDIRDLEERRKVIAGRLKLQSKMIFQSRIKKQSKGRNSLVYSQIATLTEAQSVRFFKEWRDKKDRPVENRCESPNIFDDFEPMDETEPSSSQSDTLKFKILATTSQIQDDDFVDKKKKSSRLSTKNWKEKSESGDLWLSKDNAEMGNKNPNPRNASRRKLYGGLSSIPNPFAATRGSQIICDYANGKRKRYDTEEKNEEIVDKFELLLDSAENTDIESAKRARDEPMSPEF